MVKVFITTTEKQNRTSTNSEDAIREDQFIEHLVRGDFDVGDFQIWHHTCHCRVLSATLRMGPTYQLQRD